MYKKLFGKKMRAYREKLGLTQEKFSEAVGVSANYIGVLERGEKSPSFKRLVDIANELETTTDVLLEDSLMYCGTKGIIHVDGFEELSEEERRFVRDLVKWAIGYMRR